MFSTISNPAVRWLVAALLFVGTLGTAFALWYVYHVIAFNIEYRKYKRNRHNKKK